LLYTNTFLWFAFHDLLTVSHYNKYHLI
jgi:hypothetical protein